MPSSGNVLLITGIPGIGKTTIVKKVIASLPDLNIAGFYTQEIRVNNIRQGFELVTLPGDRLVMAHIASDSAYRVGKYGVDVAAVENAVEITLSEDYGTEIFIIDEIGKMECYSDIFVQRISSLLDARKPVVATVALKGGGFISEVKKRTGAELWEVTKKNRNDMAVKIIGWLRERLHR